MCSAFGFEEEEMILFEHETWNETLIMVDEFYVDEIGGRIIVFATKSIIIHNLPFIFCYEI